MKLIRFIICVLLLFPLMLKAEEEFVLIPEKVFDESGIVDSGIVTFGRYIEFETDDDENSFPQVLRDQLMLLKNKNFDGFESKKYHVGLDSGIYSTLKKVLYSSKNIRFHHAFKSGGYYYVATSYRKHDKQNAIFLGFQCIEGCILIYDENYPFFNAQLNLKKESINKYKISFDELFLEKKRRLKFPFMMLGGQTYKDEKVLFELLPNGETLDKINLFYKLWRNKSNIASAEKAKLLNYFASNEKNRLKLGDYFGSAALSNDPRSFEDFEVDYVINAFPFYISVKLSEDKLTIVFADVFKENTPNGELEYRSLFRAHSLSNEVLKYDNYFTGNKFVKISNNLELKERLLPDL